MARDRKTANTCFHLLVFWCAAAWRFSATTSEAWADRRGDWKTAAFDELAGDVVAAFAYLQTRSDIDHAQIGLIGVSQAGWILPLAAVRAKGMAFLISVSGTGVPAADTTIDHAQREMTASGMPPGTVAEIIALMRLQYEFARTGEGWAQYAAAREKLAARIGPPPDTFPGSPDHPQFQVIRRSYLYEPAPTLRQLHVPVLAVFGELDNNILPQKNRDAWEAALKGGGNRDYTLRRSFRRPTTKCSRRRSEITRKWLL